MKDIVTITYGDGRMFRAVMTDLKINQPTKTMQTAAGHSFRTPVGLPRGSLKFMGLEEIEAPSPPPTPDPLDTENPDWGTWS